MWVEVGAVAKCAGDHRISCDFAILIWEETFRTESQRIWIHLRIVQYTPVMAIRASVHQTRRPVAWEW
jgi:hypothetical protein